MNKGFKIKLIIMSVMFIGVLIGGHYLFLLTKAFGAECEETTKWTIEEYEIQEYRCMGWAGPPYYPLDIFKNGSKVADRVIKNDSCLIVFVQEPGVYISLNNCDNSIKENRAYKNLYRYSEYRFRRNVIK